MNIIFTRNRELNYYTECSLNGHTWMMSIEIHLDTDTNETIIRYYAYKKATFGEYNLDNYFKTYKELVDYLNIKKDIGGWNN